MAEQPQMPQIKDPHLVKPITPQVVAPKVAPKPLIKAPRTMDFFDAMRELANGKLIRRESWPDPNDVGFINDGWVSIRREGKIHVWKVNDGDLEGQDWVVVKELK